MTEHILQVVLLVFIAIEVGLVGILARRAYRSSKQIEGLTAATYLQARRALERHRP